MSIESFESVIGQKKMEYITKEKPLSHKKSNRNNHLKPYLLRTTSVFSRCDMCMGFISYFHHSCICVSCSTFARHKQTEDMVTNLSLLLSCMTSISSTFKILFFCCI